MGLALPTKELPFLDSALWQEQDPLVLVSIFRDGPAPVSLTAPASLVHRSATDVPIATITRVSQSTKRLEGDLVAKEVASGPWGRQYEVGHGAIVGYAWLWDQRYTHAHALPDIVHLLSTQQLDPVESQKAEVVWEFKGLRLVTVTYGDVVDVLLTTKARWFRQRYNPKTLGYAKEER